VASSLDKGQRVAIADFDGSMDERVQELVLEAWTAGGLFHLEVGMRLEEVAAAYRLVAVAFAPSLERTWVVR
jgi:hypothetical protein